MGRIKYVILFLFIVVLLIIFSGGATPNTKNTTPTTSTRNVWKEHIEERKKTKNMTYEEKLQYYQNKLDAAGYKSGGNSKNNK